MRLKTSTSNIIMSQSDYKFSEDNGYYYLIRKYYKGPKFREQIKLTKEAWKVTVDGDNMVVDYRK